MILQEVFLVRIKPSVNKTNSRRIIIGLGLSRKIGPWSIVQWNLEVRHVGRGRQKGHIPPNVSSVVEF